MPALGNNVHRVKACLCRFFYLSLHVLFTIKRMLGKFGKFALFLIAVLLPLSSGAQSELYTSYINKYMPMAIDQMTRYKIPASITMAQALLESRAGTSRLARQANNHFGIKCGSQWTGPYFVMDDDYRNEHFRVYKSVKDSYEDHSLFLRRNARYAGLFKLRLTDYRGWARGLKAAGYATNPAYAESLIQLIENYNLDKLDHTFSGHHHQTITPAEEELIPRVMMNNRNFYTVARAGDTYKSIGKEMGVSERRLRKYNEVDRHYVLHEGDYVYFEKKQKKAERRWRGVYHRMKEGESVYDIAQRYGMRVKTLYKINHLSEDYVPHVDDLIKLR
jgi:hypothetical protein